MAFTVIIPARYASTRLPGKPLQEIAGEPMIRHVCRRAEESRAQRVVVATDDERIRSACDEFGAEVQMTSAAHTSGTDRLEEVVRRLGMDDDAIVVNVQGDEPQMPPTLINQVAENLMFNEDADVATLCERIHDPESLFNPNVVKVVYDRNGSAMYFSRAPIPWARDHFDSSHGRDALPSVGEWHRHIGLYAYRVSLLRRFVTWPPAPPENLESLEQLRALWNGARIHVAVASVPPPPGVDTPEDLERIRNRLAR